LLRLLCAVLDGLCGLARDLDVVEVVLADDVDGVGV
jgi:hypothetical protein